VVKKLDELKLLDNTLIIVTSDNGGVMDDGYIDGTGTDTSGHKCNGKLRGVKGSNYEGGHRVPFVVHYPGEVPAGKESNEMMAHVDFLATVAGITEQPLPADAGPDSFNMWPAIQGKKLEAPTREHLITQAGNANVLALRQGPWKLIVGGPKMKGPELFHLGDDPNETKNLASANEAKVKELSEKLEQFKTSGKSR
jgi:arylsulfatase A-like enzyme